MIARKYRRTKCPKRGSREKSRGKIFRRKDSRDKNLEKRVKNLVLNWVLQLEGPKLFTRLGSLSFLSLVHAYAGRLL